MSGSLAEPRGCDDPPGVTECRLFARACAFAAFMDACIPRYGLASCASPRQDIPRLALGANVWAAYEVCLDSCLAGLGEAPHAFHVFWVEAVKRSIRWGNAGAGMLLLFALQAAALGYSLAKYSSDNIYHVMGSAKAAVEAAGVEGALSFYTAMEIVSPRYLARIAYGGMPSITDGGLAKQDILEKRLTLANILAEASLYDPVSKDAYTGFTISFGEAYPAIDLADLEKSLPKTTYCIAALEGDLLVKRKAFNPILAQQVLKLLCEERSPPVDPRDVLGGGGPGSSADIVANALARRFYELLSKASN